MSDSTPRSNRATLAKLGAVVVVAAVAAVLLARGYDLKALVQRGVALIRETGPGTFFLAMAVLSAAGVPMTFFTLTAGSVFAPQIGWTAVIVLSLAALTANMAFSYFLARRAFRPLLESLLRRLGYRIPEMDSGDFTDLIILLRVTPGIPFPVQNYLLGVTGVPFGKFLLLSSLIQWPLNVAFIFFGDALLSGKGRLALFSLLTLLALMVLTHLVRKHYGAKKKAAG